MAIINLLSLIYFAGAAPSATEDFLLTSPSPLLHLRSQQTGTLRECGLLESTTIFIHWTPAGQSLPGALESQAPPQVSSESQPRSPPCASPGSIPRASPPLASPGSIPRAYPRLASPGSIPRASPPLASPGSIPRASPPLASPGSIPRASPPLASPGSIPRAYPPLASPGSIPRASPPLASPGSIPRAYPPLASPGSIPRASPPLASPGSIPRASPPLASPGSIPRAYPPLASPGSIPRASPPLASPGSIPRAYPPLASPGSIPRASPPLAPPGSISWASPPLASPGSIPLWPSPGTPPRASPPWASPGSPPLASPGSIPQASPPLASQGPPPRASPPGASPGSPLWAQGSSSLSPPQSPPRRHLSSGSDLRAVLHNLQSNIKFEETPPMANRVNVVRGDIIESAFRAFRRKQFSPNCKLDVVFVDTCGQGEGAVDNGGPTREFLTLLMKELLSSRYFVGPAWRKNLGLDSVGLNRGIYRVIGKAISVCLVHGGVGPHVFSRRLLCQLTGEPTPPVDIEEVDDEDLKQQLQKAS
ncbi:uncharacterized protein DKFZp434B061-like [Carassius gibelio]|uniref:uncharacterized protein DKFZp434B061-like n=1 Tax=Carassius gibelio TaxID=101364 RepID=UPI0022777182|nr:uncharacterized protein DKFZp434B061-like [Carassius gibelio]